MASVKLPLMISTRFPTKFRTGHRCIHITKRKEQSKITKEVDGSICIIGINRPEKKNAINSQIADELREKFNEFEANSSEKIAVLYGHGGTFCSGYDLAEVKNLNKEQMEEFIKKQDGPMGPTRMFLKKPVIAAIEGHAVAGGLELALMCDLRIADETAILGVFCRRYGVPLIDGGTIKLPALIGLSRAMDLILTGRPVNSDEAYTMGLINRVVSTGTALENAVELASQLSRFPQVCMNTDRRSAYNAAFSGASNLHELFQSEAKFGQDALLDLMCEGHRNLLDRYNSK